MEVSFIANTSTSLEQTTATVSMEELAKSYLTYQVGMAIHVYLSPILTILGFFGNTLAFIVMCLPHNRHLPCCVYLAGLAISDTITIAAIFHLWMTTVVVTARGVMLECKFMAYFFNCGAVTSAITIVAVTVDRFLATCLPLKTMGWRTRKRAIGIEIVIFVVGFLLSIPSGIFAEFITSTLCTGFPLQSIGLGIYASASIGLFSLFPFVTILMMNIAIIRRIRKLRKKKPNGLRSFRDGDRGKQNSRGVNDSTHRVVFNIGPIDSAMSVEIRASTTSLSVTQSTQLDNSMSTIKGHESSGSESNCNEANLSPIDDHLLQQVNDVGHSSCTEQRWTDGVHQEAQESETTRDDLIQGISCTAATFSPLQEPRMNVGSGHVLNEAVLSAISLSDITATISYHARASNTTTNNNNNNSITLRTNYTLPQIADLLSDSETLHGIPNSTTIVANDLDRSRTKRRTDSSSCEEVIMRSNSALEVNSSGSSDPGPPPATSSAVSNGPVPRSRSQLALAIERLRFPKSTSEKRCLDSQLSKMLLIVSFTFLLLTLPQYIRYLVYSFISTKASPAAYANYLLVYQITQKLYIVNSSINFILYCIGTNRFRQDTSWLLCRCRKR